MIHHHPRHHRRGSGGIWSGDGGLGRVASLPIGLMLLLALLAPAPRKAAGAPRVHIPDDLEGVVDDEEDEDFAAWGRNRVKEDAPGGVGGGGGPQAMDVDAGGNIDVAKLMKKQASGPQLTFARLKPDPAGKRTIDDVNALGAKWASLLRSGGMSEKVYGIDENTVLMSLTDGSAMDEVREFLWLQEEVEEFEWNQQVWRRGSDQAQPPKQRAAPPPSEGTKKKDKKKKGKGRKKSKRAKEAVANKADL